MSSPTFLELTNAIESFIDNNWTYTPVAYENSSFETPLTEPWIYVQIINNPSENAALGSDCIRLHGFISILIYSRYDVGTAEAIDLADKVAAMMQNQTINDFVLTYTTDINRLGDARRQMNRIESGFYTILTQTRFETS